MPDARVIRATIATLTASGLDVNTTSVRGVCVVVVTDRTNGERYIHRDVDQWVALVVIVTMLVVLVVDQVSFHIRRRLR